MDRNESLETLEQKKRRCFFMPWMSYGKPHKKPKPKPEPEPETKPTPPPVPPKPPPPTPPQTPPSPGGDGEGIPQVPCPEGLDCHGEEHLWNEQGLDVTQNEGASPSCPLCSVEEGEEELQVLVNVLYKKKKNIKEKSQ